MSDDPEAPLEGVRVTGVSELVLEVVDLEVAEAFYSGVLGLPVVERWPDREAIWVMAGDRTRIATLSSCGPGTWRSTCADARGLRDRAIRTGASPSRRALRRDRSCDRVRHLRVTGACGDRVRG